MSKQEMDRTWITQCAQGRLIRKAPGEDITRDAVIGWISNINGLVLDLGCGEGRLEMLLHQGKIIGLDEQINLLKHARKNVSPDIGFLGVVGNFVILPFHHASVDAVVCLNTLENYTFDHVIQFLEDMLALLKPGGRLVVSYRGGAGARMRYLEFLTTLSGSQKCQYRFNPRRWIERLDGVFKARIVPLLRQPRGWRKWLGTPADARALLIVDKAP